jgi:hypothetical protein
MGDFKTEHATKNAKMINKRIIAKGLRIDFTIAKESGRTVGGLHLPQF